MTRVIPDVMENSTNFAQNFNFLVMRFSASFEVGLDEFSKNRGHDPILSKTEYLAIKF